MDSLSYSILSSLASLLCVILLVKVWRMTTDIRLLKKHFVYSDKVNEAKIAFLKGESVKAKELLDSACFKELVEAKEIAKTQLPYEQRYSSICFKYDELYYSMSLTPPNFEHYKDITNIP